MIIYGTRATGIGSFQISGTKCAHCGETSPQDVHVFGRYAHVFWIPLFPAGKVAVAECTHCKRTIKKKEFSSQLKEQYNRVASNYVKRPIWHWLGAALIGLFVAFTTWATATHVPDYREESFNADLAAVTSNPSEDADSTSFLLKTFFDENLTADMKPETFEYFTKVKGDKMLVLAKVPTLKSLKKSERPKVADMIRQLIELSPDLAGKKLYLGIYGKYNMMVVETPTGKHNSRFASSMPLYEFYGAAEKE